MSIEAQKWQPHETPSTNNLLAAQVSMDSCISVLLTAMCDKRPFIELWAAIAIVSILQP